MCSHNRLPSRYYQAADLGCMILLAVPDGFGNDHGYVRIIANAGTSILSFEGSGDVSWTNDAAGHDYSLMIATNLFGGEWIIVGGGQTEEGVQTVRMPVFDDDMVHTIEGRFMFSTQPLPWHPVTVEDENYELLASGWTDEAGTFRFGFFTNGAYFVGAPDAGEYLNGYKYIEVDGASITDVVIQIEKELWITEPASFQLMTNTSPMIIWADPIGCDSFSVSIWDWNAWDTVESSPVLATEYQIQASLAEGDYAADVTGYDSEGNPIGRGSVNFTIVAGGGGTGLADLTGYVFEYPSGILLTNYLVILKDENYQELSRQYSGSNGEFVFPDMANGIYHLIVPTNNLHYFQDRTVFFDTAAPWDEWSVAVLRKLTILTPNQWDPVTQCEVFIDWSSEAGADHYAVELYNIDLNTFVGEPIIETSYFTTTCLDDGLYSLTITAIDDEERHIAKNAISFTLDAE